MISPRPGAAWQNAVLLKVLRSSTCYEVFAQYFWILTPATRFSTKRFFQKLVLECAPAHPFRLNWGPRARTVVHCVPSCGMRQAPGWAVAKKAGTYQESDLPGRCFRCDEAGHWVSEGTFEEEEVSTQAQYAFGLSPCSDFSHRLDASIPNVSDAHTALLSLLCFCGQPLFNDIGDAQRFLQAVAARDATWPWVPSCAACSLPASPATMLLAPQSVSPTLTSPQDSFFREACCATQLDSQLSDGSGVYMG